jgi:hypothetical protein
LRKKTRDILLVPSFSRFLAFAGSKFKVSKQKGRSSRSTALLRSMPDGGSKFNVQKFKVTPYPTLSLTLCEHVRTRMPGAATRAACRIGATLTKGKGIKAKVEDPGCVLAIATPCADPFTF